MKRFHLYFPVSLSPARAGQIFADRKLQFIALSIISMFILFLFSACQPATGPKIVVSSAWGRPSPSMAQAEAIYMIIENQGNQTDRLLSVSSSLAEIAEVHESYMDNNMMKMRMLSAGIEILAGAKVELKPGGYHVMLVNLLKNLEAGTKEMVVLKFEKAGEIKVEVEIREQ